MRALRKILLGIILLAVLFVAFLAVTSRPYTISIGIDIARPPADVWRVLTSTADFPTWNPFIHGLEGNLAVGEWLTAEIGEPGNTFTFRPIVLAFVPERQLIWRGSALRPGIFDGEHSFILSPQGNGTRFTQTETFTGLLVGPLTHAFIEDTKAGFNAMNLALKARTESPKP